MACCGQRFVKAKDYVPKEKAFPMWVDMTTFHGVKDWYTSKHCCSFFVWAILIIFCMSVCFYQVIALIVVYFGSNHYTTSMYVTQNQFPPFPNVTICNLNRVNNTARNELKLTTQAVSFLFEATRASYDFELIATAAIDAKDAWDNFLERSDIDEKLKDPTKLLEHLGHSCDQTFVTCHFAGEEFNCCDRATKIMTKDYGLCWALTPPVSDHSGFVTQDLPGIANGLHVMLLPNIQEYLPGDVFFNNYLEYGMVVSIDYNPYRMAFPDPFRISIGQHVQISLEAVKHTWDLPNWVIFAPECVKDAELKMLTGTYDHLNCVSDCMQQYIYDTCGCLMISEHKMSHRTCDGNDFMRCFNLTGNLNLMKKESFTSCLSGCKEPCNTTWEVKTTSSSNDYPEERFLQTMKGMLESGEGPHPDTAELRTMVNLNVYFPSRGYTTVERHQRTSILQLVANIGGQMGLWVGASVITLFQLCYYVGYGVFRNCYYDKDKGQPDQESPEESHSSPAGPRRGGGRGGRKGFFRRGGGRGKPTAKIKAVFYGPRGGRGRGRQRRETVDERQVDVEESGTNSVVRMIDQRLGF